MEMVLIPNKHCSFILPIPYVPLGGKFLDYIWLFSVASPGPDFFTKGLEYGG